MRPRALLAGILALAGMVAPRALAEEGVVHREHVDAELVAETTTLVRGEDAWIGVRLRIDPHWHVYWKFVGDSGDVPKVRWRVPAGFEIGPIEWPAPKRLLVFDQAVYGYEGEVLLPMRVRVSATAPPGDVVFDADVSWLVCEEECLPGDASLSLRLPVRDGTPPPSASAASFRAARALLPRPLPIGAATLRRERGALRLDLRGEGPWAADGARVEFFPDAWKQIEHAAPQPVERTPGLVSLRLTPSSAAAAPVARLSGLLRVEDAAHVVVGYALDVAVEAKDAAARTPDGARSGGIGGETGGTSAGEGAAGGASARSGAAGDGGPTSHYVEFGGGTGGDPSLWFALVLALAGGVILNLMPCVLPVLGLKVLSFVEQAGERPERVRRHGYAFTLGVLASFWAIAAVLIAVRAGGEGLGWGFQLQEPLFVGALTVVMTLLALNLLGVFELGALFTGVASRARSTGYLGSFASGALATLVATPCTAPFMGPALGFALVRPAFDVVAVLTALGLGMALPYLLLSAFPRWLKFVPRPGAWMDTFRRAMAFPLLATVVWLATVFGSQVSVSAMGWLLFGLLLVGLAAALFGRFGGVERSVRMRALVGRTLAGALLVAGGFVVAGAARPTATVGGLPWEPYGDARLAAALAEERPVFVDFTADWCLTCKANEKTVLSTDAVREAVARSNAALLQADWTRRDPEVTRALERLGRRSVPVYVIYRPGGALPLLLPTLITPSLVARALDEASASGSP